MNMKFLRKLPTPQEIKNQYPVSNDLADVKIQRDKEIRDIFLGASDKFLLVIGPCSADNGDAVLEYVSRLKKVAEKVKDKIIVIPRVYTNKPRTQGMGYMGMLHQPNPQGETDLLKGLLAIRDLHLTILKNYHLTCADELLYPENHRYLSDLLSYVAVGARSVEDQQHRLVASGLNIPVGMKNPISGDITAVTNAILSAQQPHTFLYRGWEVVTEGNVLTHAVLRGYKDNEGRDVSNFDYASLNKVVDALQSCHVTPSILVDTNHSNSGKDFEMQSNIALNVLDSRNKSETLKKSVKGLMIESYILDGAGKIGQAPLGQSITDPCLGWEKTEKLIYKIAEKL